MTHALLPVLQFQVGVDRSARVECWGNEFVSVPKSSFPSCSQKHYSGWIPIAPRSWPILQDPLK